MQIEYCTSGKHIDKITYSHFDTTFGLVLTAWHEDRLCFLAFTRHCGIESVIVHIQKLFPKAQLIYSENHYDIFTNPPKALLLVGTPFQHRVWRALSGLRSGEIITYAELTTRAGVPRAIRATASAVGANPISYFIPCHRILPASGGAGRYHWGDDIKLNLLNTEGYLP